MDRREALKRLAVGGATAVGATAIMTSTAFGASGTQNCAALEANPTVTVAQDGNAGPGNATITLTLTTSPFPFNCPSLCGHGGPATLVLPVSTTWTLNGASPTSQPTDVSAQWVSQGNGTPPFTVSFKVQCIDRTGDAVCSTYAGTGNIFLNGNSAPSIPQQPIGSLAYGNC